MKTSLYFILTVLFSASAVYAEDPSVDSVEFLPLYGDAYKVTYRLAGDSAIITADFQTNTLSDASGEWVTVGGKAQRRVGGDVNRWVEKPSDDDTRLALYWFPEDDWAGKTMPASQVRCVVSAWTTNDPPDVMVLDLRETGRRTYYPSLDHLPDGIEAKKYKGRYYPMRRIHAKNVTWVMGACKGDGDWGKADNTGTENTEHRAHKVRLTCDYYIGVYQFTAQHYEYAITRTCFAPRSANRLPKASWDTAFRRLRGSTLGLAWPVYTDGVFDYDASHKVDSGSRVNKIREVTGLYGLDLPTEAQWEFACREGSGAAYPDGTSLAAGSEVSWPYLETHSRYKNNSGQDTTAANNLSTNDATAVVGSYLAGRWGLYDMFGNVCEMTLDWHAKYEVTDGVIDDPCGSVAPETSDNKRTMRGGAYLHAPENVRAADRYGVKRSQQARHIGFRVCLPLD
jgi:formylglycine-generating enzyme required for sulfatase activity